MLFSEADLLPLPRCQVEVSRQDPNKTVSIGVGEVVIDGRWPKNEFDGQSHVAVSAKRRHLNGELTRDFSTRPGNCPDWVPISDESSKYAGEVFLEITFYPVAPSKVNRYSPDCRTPLRVGKHPLWARFLDWRDI